MELLVENGEQIVVILKMNNKVYPYITSVSGIYFGAITVPEFESINGLARIYCNSSKYEYYGFDKQKLSLDVVKLLRRDGEDLLADINKLIQL